MVSMPQNSFRGSSTSRCDSCIEIVRKMTVVYLMEDEKNTAALFSGLGGANCYLQPPTTFQHSLTIRDYAQYHL